VIIEAPGILQFCIVSTQHCGCGGVLGNAIERRP
jgi:hypothetical protein